MSGLAKKAAKTLKKSAQNVALRGTGPSCAGLGNAHRCSNAAQPNSTASRPNTQLQANTALPWRSVSQPAR